MTMPRGRTSRDDNNDGGRGDYMNLALGGKVVGDVLRNLGKAANPGMSVVSGLVGKLASHRRKVKKASTGIQRMTPKKPTAKPQPGAYGGAGQNLPAQYRKEPAARKGQKTQSQIMAELDEEGNR